MNYPDFDIIVKFDEPGVRYSHNGGGFWYYTANRWNTLGWMIRHIINRYAVYYVLNPRLAQDESLCGVCASLGKVGIMRFNRITKGREAQAQVIYPAGGEPYVDDVWHYCRYRVERCDRCGHEDSDYE